MEKRIRPYRNKKQSLKRERVIMITSSAFVMAALTMTGLYMKEKNIEDHGSEYSVDIAKLENNVNDKYAELVEQTETSLQEEEKAAVEGDSVLILPKIEANNAVSEDEMDYMPREDSIIDFSATEVDSGKVENPDLMAMDEVSLAEAPQAMEQEFTFTEEEGLYVPIMNDIMMHYSMESTVYFATLDQYKYNPAVIFKAEEGSEVFACADAKVVDMYQNEELGQVLVLDLGDGYQAIYGQLKNVKVAVGDTVTVGQSVANVATPTKYYSLEGFNLYFSLEKDGVAVNPEGMM